MRFGIIWYHCWRALRYLWPWFLLRRFTSPIPPGIWIVNVFMQRVLRINGNVAWMVHFTSYVTGDVKIGNNVWKSFALSGGCYIQGGNGIVIGDDTIFAPGVKIISANHDPKDLTVWKSAPPLRIGNRCWIGANAVILPGVEIGDNCIVGAGAIVTKSMPNGSVAIGNPLKLFHKFSTME